MTFFASKFLIVKQPKAKAFLLGIKRTIPLMAGVLPFGILYATLAGSVGFPPWLTVFTSMVVFGGSSQLVFIDLYHTLNSALQAVLGSNIVNARHLIYSAGVSSHFSSYPRKWRLILSYLLTDQLYAISEAHKNTIDAYPLSVQPWFYFGSGFSTWSSWIAATVIGIVFGQNVPSSWNLAFSIPLMFLPLVFMTSKNKFGYLTCAISAACVFMLHKLPFGFGVLVSIILAAYLGYLLQRHWRAKS
jgi:4-azaleucine resistance transporter AzlC